MFYYSSNGNSAIFICLFEEKMKIFLYIILIPFFSLIIISCGDDKEEYSENSGTTTDNTTTTSDTTAPTVESISPTDNQSGVSITDNISVTFSEAMDTTSVTTNTSNSSCSGSIQLSSDNFSSCVKMSGSPTTSNSDKTFLADPSDNLSYYTNYKIRLTTAVKDTSGNALGSQYETESGFKTSVQAWTGTKQIGNSDNNLVRDLTVDSSNNIYVAGYLKGDLDGNTSAGNWDIFITKYNPGGVRQWTSMYGSNSADLLYAVTTDTSNNIIVTGSTYGRMTGSRTPDNDEDVFVAKYYDNGTMQWINQFYTVGSEWGYGITTDSDNNIYVSGATTNNFGDGASNAGQKDFFLMKLYDNGTRQWTTQMGTNGNEFGYDVAVSSSNNVYVAGEWQGNTWLAKHHDNGTQQWEKKLSGGNNLTWLGVAADTNNNIYVAGHSDGALDGVSNAGNYDVYLAKYVDNGTKEWLSSVGTSSNESGDCCSIGLTVDTSNNIYVAAQTQGALDGSNAGNKDIFLSKFYDNGTRIWIKQIGSSAADVVFGASADSNNNIFLGGYTSGGIDSNSSNGGQDGFLIKYNSDGDKE